MDTQPTLLCMIHGLYPIQVAQVAATTGTDIPPVLIHTIISWVVVIPVACKYCVLIPLAPVASTLLSLPIPHNLRYKIFVATEAISVALVTEKLICQTPVNAHTMILGAATTPSAKP